jgi:Flp pilus assembly protein TadG
MGMKRKNRQTGVAAIEFAILLIPMVMMAFGITEFGRAIYQYNTLAKSARDATRYLSTQSPGDAAAWTKATCLAVYGTFDCSGTPLAPGLTTAMVSICDASNCAGTHQAQATGSGTINLVTTTIGGGQNPYSFVSLVPFVVPNINFGPISVTARQI